MKFLIYLTIGILVNLINAKFNILPHIFFSTASISILVSIFIFNYVKSKDSSNENIVDDSASKHEG